MRRNGGFNKEPRGFTINVTHVNWTNNGIWFGHGSPKPIVEGHVQKGSCLFVGPKLPWALMARVDPQPKNAGLLAPFHPHYAPYFLPYSIDVHRIITSYLYMYIYIYMCPHYILILVRKFHYTHSSLHSKPSLLLSSCYPPRLQGSDSLIELLGGFGSRDLAIEDSPSGNPLEATNSHGLGIFG